MDSIKLYKDLITEIGNLRELERDLRQQKRLLWKEIRAPRDINGYDISKDVSPRAQRPLETVLTEIMEVEYRLKYVCDILKSRERTRKRIGDNLKRLEGVDYQVVYLRDIEGLRLGEIAMELNFSEDWIKRVSARNKKI